jgi:hypothetical protein
MAACRGAGRVQRPHRRSDPGDPRVSLARAAAGSSGIIATCLASPPHLSGVPKSAADRIIRHLAPFLALHPRRRHRKDTVLIADGTLVPTRDHAVARRSKNYRYSANHQVLVGSWLVVAVGQPVPGTMNDRTAWQRSGAKEAAGRTIVITDGGYQGTGLLIPHHPEFGHLTSVAGAAGG